MALVGVDENTPQLLANLSQEMIIFMLLVTILVQWTIFLFNYVGAYTEGTGLAGIGFRPMEQVAHMSRLGRTAVYFGIALVFLLAANLILAGVAWFLGQIGLPLPGEIGMIVPTDPVGRVVWVAVSFTAGFCEETAFRGYLMSRLRLVSGLKGWAMPVIVSSVAFGVCHAYQGWPGFIVITLYGAMFAWLYIRTGSIWPAIIAHSLQDLGALVWPH